MNCCDISGDLTAREVQFLLKLIEEAAIVVDGHKDSEGKAIYSDLDFYFNLARKVENFKSA